MVSTRFYYKKTLNSSKFHGITWRYSPRIVTASRSFTLRTEDLSLLVGDTLEAAPEAVPEESKGRWRTAICFRLFFVYIK